MNPLDVEAVEMTYESLMDEIKDVERQLIAVYPSLTGNVQKDLLAKIGDGEIPETTLVSKWLSLYGALTHWSDMVDCVEGCGCRARSGPRADCKMCSDGHGEFCSACIPVGCTNWSCGCNYGWGCKFKEMQPEDGKG